MCAVQLLSLFESLPSLWMLHVMEVMQGFKHCHMPRNISSWLSVECPPSKIHLFLSRFCSLVAEGHGDELCCFLVQQNMHVDNVE